GQEGTEQLMLIVDPIGSLDRQCRERPRQVPQVEVRNTLGNVPGGYWASLGNPGLVAEGVQPRRGATWAKCARRAAISATPRDAGWSIRLWEVPCGAKGYRINVGGERKRLPGAPYS